MLVPRRELQEYEYLPFPKQDNYNNFNLDKRVTACVACETALRDYQENVSTGQTHEDGRTDRRQINVPLCFAGDTKTTTLEKNDCSICKHTDYAPWYVSRTTELRTNKRTDGAPSGPFEPGAKNSARFLGINWKVYLDRSWSSAYMFNTPFTCGDLFTVCKFCKYEKSMGSRFNINLFK